MTAPQQRYVHTRLIVAGTGTLSITARCQDATQYARSWIFARRARTYGKKHLLEVISFIPDRRYARDENALHPHDQQGQRRATRRIVSAAAAAAWLLHSTPRNTRMTSGQSNQSSA
ncbi:MAG: hypothetical protein KatS3mg054_1430 [Chloroflexus sp.]|jgi:hypothetical protein|nr:MAG: hypothetical protein KatS3mg054_1430 [Chloroflexus sp.]